MNLDYNETEFTKLDSITIPESFYRRLKTTNPVIDSFFSEGLVPGSSFTITGAMGTGKSTFCLQYLEMLAKQGYRVGICSSEEVIHQVAYTCKRLNVQTIEIANISNVDKIAKSLSDFDIIIVDSFQGLTHPNYEGRVRAIEKYAIEKLYIAAKENETVIGFICHITKSGELKGGTIIPHTVDMNIQIEKSDSEEMGRNIVITKNRFGACNELNCNLTQNGYDFSQSTSQPTITVNTRKSSRDDIKQQILSMEGPITHASVTKLLDGNASKAYFLLRELTMTNVLVKNGRGADAPFEKV